MTAWLVVFILEIRCYLGSRVDFFRNISFALLGLIALAGMIMRNAVILVDQIESDVDQGLTRGEAIVEATVRRARPVILTALAAILAMIPLSRSAFFARFTQAVGVPPMEYLLAWRMALAKRLLRARDLAMDEVAARVGYSSASTFSTAFARHAGLPPARYARSPAESGRAVM